MVAERAGTSPPSSSVKLSGSIPPLAESFHQRPETGLDLRAGLYPGDTVVLTHGEDTPAAPATQGGTGKTQLAVAFTHALWSARAVEALIWVLGEQPGRRSSPASPRRPCTVGAADPGLGAEAAASRFINWLAHTRRPWALILDDLASLDDLEISGPRDRPGRSSSPPGCRRPSSGPRRRTRRPRWPGRGSPWSAGSAARGAGLPERPADRLPRPAGRGARARRRAGRAAARAGPGRRRDDREPAELPGVPRPVSASDVSTCPRSGSTASPRRCWPPGRWPSSARTTCRAVGRPGRPSRWPPCWIRTGYPALY